MTLFQTQAQTIEATYIKYENSDDNINNLELINQLKHEKTQNKKLLIELNIANNNLAIVNQSLDSVKKFNRKLELDLEYSKIQANNLKNINRKFIRTINNLQSYRTFVADLLAKKTRTNKKIDRLVKELKNMQNILRKKNEIIKQKTIACEVARLQASHLIKETYGIK
jgi:DNA repair ATPase RecN